MFRCQKTRLFLVFVLLVSSNKPKSVCVLDGQIKHSLHNGFVWPLCKWVSARARECKREFHCGCRLWHLAATYAKAGPMPMNSAAPITTPIMRAHAWDTAVARRASSNRPSPRAVATVLVVPEIHSIRVWGIKGTAVLVSRFTVHGSRSTSHGPRSTVHASRFTVQTSTPVSGASVVFRIVNSSTFVPPWIHYPYNIDHKMGCWFNTNLAYG